MPVSAGNFPAKLNMQPRLPSPRRVAAQFNQGAAANGLSAVRSRVAGVHERTVRSTAAAEAVAELTSEVIRQGFF